jgi:hypothetical protein
MHSLVQFVDTWRARRARLTIGQWLLVLHIVHYTRQR